MRMTWTRRDKAINQFAKGVVRQSRGNLTREKANSSKTLWSSIKYKFKDNVLEFFMEYYGAFLDKGVSGTGKLWLSKTKSMPVAYNKSDADPEYSFKSSKKAIGGDLSRWLRSKGIPESAEYPIRRSIHAKGIRPRRFFTYAFDQQSEKFEGILHKGITSDIESNLDKILKRQPWH